MYKILKKPVITAPGTITVPTNKLMTESELKAKISVNDGLDGVITNFTISGYDNYRDNYETVGSYAINVSVSDRAGNQATATITIKTEDNIAPDIWLDDYFIVLRQGEQLTAEQIKQYASKVLGVSVVQLRQ